MLALSFERLCLALQRQNPQMLKQDLKPDEDEHDATHDGGGFFNYLSGVRSFCKHRISRAPQAQTVRN